MDTTGEENRDEPGLATPDSAADQQMYDRAMMLVPRPVDAADDDPRPLTDPCAARRMCDEIDKGIHGCQDPELAWRAARAAPAVREMLLRRHSWLRDIIRMPPPPAPSSRSGLRPSQAPRRVRQRSRPRRAASRGAMRGPPGDDDDLDEPDEVPPRPPDRGVA